ncbi:MAG: Peptidoglycan glycosyltransferase [Candidatus Woesebacteria bacterium GW2011_GWA1_33_30]|uniref:Peptidoglycan glycosyltransferase n=1 Tax=Candidatus Woesebacteria bacterium GW2011_GWA2_33_28 TaxID=1618561 RepID=A0A0F9ZQU2_9BACT|nr:MAG: Peptidoglycan glycosyltransferase [Candidatus Woesebacteria bacterium GW2011_GWA2_33_28]KKP47534.1 MAG: Peptidoglycan glycosyltransferase [Candidatus Woesebacteria bacterium GW2011_GWA1_33_30]KKP49146.1 MAG: Peptidoglycan glycosyltransferase [Microgenomates group bacterium GW2011_GWC1_33_32]KKP51528.1 MAG: Peptidoglycan glycosyltransferase [Candidatus Woesebacteria bacterium GW2011_GWB1_33_38]
MRLRFVIGIFILIFLGLVARLFYWQVIKGGTLSKQAELQYNGSTKIISPRGSIYASDNTWLAIQKANWLLFAEKPNLENPRIVADSISSIIEEENNDIYALLTKPEIVWIPIKHKITGEQKRQVEELNIKGLGFELEETRFYPEGSVSAQLLGFVGKNNEGVDTGYFGLEGYYDISLKGKSGFIEREKDLKGVPFISGSMSEISSVSGANLITHIDKRITSIVDSKLKEAIEKYGAKEGSVIVMNPKNGAILAMSSYPSYDPAKYNEYDGNLYKNPAISDTFEPGSVFKVLVMAAGLDDGAVSPDTICDICSGPLKVDKYFIETWNRKYYPDSTMTDVIVHSDNVGMSFVAQKLGADKLYDYLDKFGIGKLTGIDLQGESNIPMRKRGTWNIVDLATASFGQGISTTPIQIIRAVSAVANDGVLVTPKVVEKIELEGWSQNVDKKEEIRVIKKDTAEKMTEIMVQAAGHGEAQWTNLKGFSVAGKTGTAQIPIAGHYDPDATIASFIGFAPSNNPKFVMLVTLKEPQSSQWASETAAPLWYSIAKDLFAYFGIQPDN